MIYGERETRHDQALDIAQKMMVAARTAPKGRGVDILECCVIETEDSMRVVKEMQELGESWGQTAFLRDAKCVAEAECVLLVGTREQPLGLNCGHCGSDRCNGRAKGVPCALNSIDIGIALGSAVSKAADYRVDSRIMFTAGLAAQHLDILPGCTQVFAVLVCVSSRNSLFDRPRFKKEA